MGVKFNDDELCALAGLPLAAQVLYMRGIKPHMDCMSGIVGIWRGISLKRLGECLNVVKHQGFQREVYSEQQVRRLVEWLVKAGLLERRSIEKVRLIFFLPLTDTDKADTKADTVERSNSKAYRDKADTKADTIKEGKSPPPYQQIVELYHKALPEMIEVYKLTPLRERQIKALWEDKEELPSLEDWERYFKFVRGSQFLMGNIPPINGHKQFKGSLEFITNPTNYVKITERHYHDEKGQARRY